MIGRKDPEVGHNANCEPLPESSILALEVDRELPNDVRSQLLAVQSVVTPPTTRVTPCHAGRRHQKNLPNETSLGRV